VSDEDTASMQGWGITDFIIAIAILFLLILPLWFLWLKRFLKSISPPKRNVLRD